MPNGKSRLVLAVVLLSPCVRSLHAQVSEAWDSTYDGPAHRDDRVRAMAIDAAGNVYVTGWSQTGRRIQHDDVIDQEGDFATVKFDASGHQVWAGRMDSSGADFVDDSPAAMALGSDGRLHVLGSTGSGRDTDVLTVTYEADGHERWRDQLGVPPAEPGGIAADGEGNVFIAASSVLPASSNWFISTVKYNSAGNREWIAQLPIEHGNFARVTEIQVRKQGEVYVLARLDLTNNLGAFLLIKYDPDGNELWKQRHRVFGTSWALPAGMAFNSVGAVVTGALGGTRSAMATVQYDEDGNEVWARTRQEGNSNDAGLAVRVDAEGNVLVAGVTCPDGGCDFLIVKLDDVGNELWSQLLRDEHRTAPGRALALAVDGAGSAYVTGALAGDGRRLETTTVKYDRDGNTAWIARRKTAGTVDARGVAIALDPEGNVLVAEEASGSGDWHDFGVVKYVQGPASVAFSRGDANDDGARDIADAVSVLNALFAGGPQPGCAASADANADAAVDLSDAVYLLAYLFQGGAPPPAPFPDCGTAPGDPGCAAFESCKA